MDIGEGRPERSVPSVGKLTNHCLPRLSLISSIFSANKLQCFVYRHSSLQMVFVKVMHFLKMSLITCKCHNYGIYIVRVFLDMLDGGKPLEQLQREMESKVTVYRFAN